ncbi:MAG: MetQ/NlpA family ABC transporter substrate-binding protein [Firmicutes bacterium]|jgi:D-methionine transport system substrate-binding protein|nr:MetQ/NlpA family ABC transporter substrate-binding protein [Bacillota bacterium]
MTGVRNRGLLAVLLPALVLVLLAAGGVQSETKKVVLGVTAGIHEELAEVVKPVFEAQGYQLKVVVFTDYITPNLALAEGELDANSYQHLPFLQQFCADRKARLVSIGATAIFPMGIYSKKVKRLSDLRNGAIVAIPNDPTNGGRALVLLAKAGLLRLNEGAGWKATVFDIAANPKGLKITELDAAQIPRALEDVDIACINTNYAMSAGLIPARDSIFLEAADSPWVNIIAVKEGRESDPALQALVKAYHSSQVREYIESNYEGSLIPGW